MDAAQLTVSDQLPFRSSDDREVKMGGLQKNIASLFVLQGGNYILPLILLPYLVRVLGPGNYGRIAFAQALIQYFVILTDYGFNLSATRSVARIRGNPEELSRFVSSVILIKVGLMLAGFLTMLCIISLVPQWRDDWSLYLLVYLNVLGSVVFPVWLLQGMEKMKLLAAVSMSSQVFVLALVLLFVHQPADYKVAALIQASGGIICGILLLVVGAGLNSVPWSMPSVTDIRSVLADGWHLFISNVAVSLYSVSNIFLLGLLTSPAAVGYFAAAEKIIKAVNGLVTPVSQAVYPRIATMMVESKTEALHLISKLLRWQGGGMLVLSLLIFFVAEPLIKIVLGEKFLPSVVLLQWMALLPFLTGMSNVLGIQAMLNLGMKVQFSRILLFSGLFNILLVFLLVPVFQSKGSAISVLLSELTVTVLMAIVLSRRKMLKKLIWNG